MLYCTWHHTCHVLGLWREEDAARASRRGREKGQRLWRRAGSGMRRAASWARPSGHTASASIFAVSACAHKVSRVCVGGGESGSDPLYPKAVYIQLILLLLVAVPEIKSEPEPSPALTALALLGTGAARCCDEPTCDRSPREGNPGHLRTAEKAP